ncbi:MAG: hypothetical protein P0Y59_05365 [Candidatus Sphingomonas phytovorans]|nr:hypothetical protein [Sphingomonas sp.]WEK01119.1 MAG: hypothetical protein P0Y59_05365 [Sphingomonas sp.]
MPPAFWQVTGSGLAFPIVMMNIMSRYGIIGRTVSENLSKATFVFCAIGLFLILFLRDRRLSLLLIPATYVVIVAYDAATKELNVNFLYLGGWVLCGVFMFVQDKRAPLAK